MDSEFTIERGIPVPKLRKGHTRYPLRQMEVGESFFVPEKVASEFKIRAATSRFAHRCRDYAFTVRREDGPPKGVRVWRINANVVV